MLDKRSHFSSLSTCSLQLSVAKAAVDLHHLHFQQKAVEVSGAYQDLRQGQQLKLIVTLVGALFDCRMGLDAGAWGHVSHSYECMMPNKILPLFPGFII